jgi:predicted nucleotidyltransferase
LAVKTSKHDEYREVAYSSLRWEQLKTLRSRAVWIIEALDNFNLHSITHGSIARGDVNQGSDVDVFIPEVQSSFIVETALEKAKIPINSRLIVQATPTYAMKAHVEIDEKTSVSFPLMEMRRVEREFYRFGGEINLNQIRMNARVSGVDKRLMLIDPTDKGHVETCVVGKEEFAAKTLGIAAETVLDRVHALMKRDSVGRTGVFVKKELLQDETFELALKKLADLNPAVRRRMKK